MVDDAVGADAAIKIVLTIVLSTPQNSAGTNKAANSMGTIISLNSCRKYIRLLLKQPSKPAFAIVAPDTIIASGVFIEPR